MGVVVLILLIIVRVFRIVFQKLGVVNMVKGKADESDLAQKFVRKSLNPNTLTLISVPSVA